jgi:hypothetical protein
VESPRTDHDQVPVLGVGGEVKDRWRRWAEVDEGRWSCLPGARSISPAGGARAELRHR